MTQYFVFSHFAEPPIETEHDEEEEHPIDPSAFANNEDNDYLLALMLQHEYTNEFNGMMKKYESTMNRNSKRRRLTRT